MTTAALFTIDDAFWSPRLETWRTITLPHVMQQCEDTGRLRNFDRAAGLLGDAFEGRVYDDSDVYKTLEGAAYAHALQPEAALDLRVGDWVSRIAAAQRPDGYLHTWHQTHSDATPFEDVRTRHELYCAGHLLEAGLALHEATGDDRLLGVAQRLVAHIRERFGSGGRAEPTGHPELELALLRLHAATGDDDALALARSLLEARGVTAERESFGAYAQDHQPVREQREATGHAVRALYLWSAVADLVAATGDASWRPALDAVWRDLVETRMYVTGGLGSSAENEGFTAPYDLPNEEAYCETCAAIGLVMLARRMSRLDGDARSVDVLERALFNGVLAGISLSGDRFFYTNPLASRGGHERQPFFECACCPTNLARFLPAIRHLFATPTADGARLDLYAAGNLVFDGIAVRVVTGYPWAGGVRLELDVAGARAFTLRLRIPGWCRGHVVRVNGERIDAPVERGYAVIERTWRAGDTVDLDLAMPIERIRADERVATARGRVALRRGPLVYCVEGADHSGHVADLVLAPATPIEAVIRPRHLGGLITLTAESRREGRPMLLEAVPYFAWQNRDAGSMRVWIPETPEALPFADLA